MPASKMAAAALVRAPAAGQLSMLDHRNYTVAEGAPVPEILRGMLGPRCDENRDASHQLELKIQALHDGDFAKSKMKVETWTFHGDGTTWVNATSIFNYIYTGARDQLARTQKMHFENTQIPHKVLEVQGKRGGIPKKVYLMDMNDLYLVAVRLHGWEFMAEASHINAKKAVRGLAADLQDFHEQGQRSSASHLMQQGASAVAAAAIEDARPTAESKLELAERRFALKRKADEYKLDVAERRLQMSKEKLAVEHQKMTLEHQKMNFEHTFGLSIKKQNLDVTTQWIDYMETVNPDWRADSRLKLQAQEMLCNAVLTEPWLKISDVIASLKQGKPESKTPVDPHAVGILAAQLYKKKHGKDPIKHPEIVNNKTTYTNTYTEVDRPLLEEAVRQTMRKQSPDLMQYFTRSKHVV